MSDADRRCSIVAVYDAWCVHVRECGSLTYSYDRTPLSSRLQTSDGCMNTADETTVKFSGVPRCRLRSEAIARRN